MVLGAKNNGRKVFADVHMETNEMWHNNEHGQGVSREEYMQRRIDSAYLRSTVTALLSRIKDLTTMR